MCFFFFKQKTAYEMRISDWSSDVCSSDLRQPRRKARAAPGGQDVVRPRDIIADRLGRVPAEECRTRMADLIEQGLRIVDREFEMLGPEPVDQRHRLDQRCGDCDRAFGVPPGAGGFAGGGGTVLEIA